MEIFDVTNLSNNRFVCAGYAIAIPRKTGLMDLDLTPSTAGLLIL